MPDEEESEGEEAPLVRQSESSTAPDANTKKPRSFLPVLWDLKWILPTLLLETIGVTMVVPHLPEIIQNFFQGDKYLTYWASGGNLAVNSFLTFLCAPMVGRLSDHVGRKPLILLAIIMSHMHILALALNLNLWLFFLAYALTGMLGSSYPLYQAYIADKLAPEDRALGFAALVGSVALGGMFGFALGGVASAYWAPRIPIALALLNTLYTSVVVQESLLPQNRLTNNLFDIAPWHGLHYLTINPLISKLSSMTLLATTALYGLNDCIILYLKVEMNLRTSAISLWLVLSFSAMAAYQMLLFPLITPARITYHNFLLAIMAISTACMLLYGLANFAWQFYAIGVVAPIASLVWTMATAIATNQVSAHEQGVLQGSFAGLNKLGAGFGPLLFDAVAGATANTLPSSPFIMGAGFNILAGGLAALLPVEAVNNLRTHPREEVKGHT